MKEFVISEAKVETAVLVGLITQTQDERKTTEEMTANPNAPKESPKVWEKMWFDL